MQYFLHADFASALWAVLPQDPEMGPLAAAAQAASGTVTASGVVNATNNRRSFLLLDSLLYRHGPRGDRLFIMIPAAGSLPLQVLTEPHATLLEGQFGRDKTLASARRSDGWPGLPATVEEYVRGWSPVTPHVQDSHCGNSCAELRVTLRVLCVPRRGAAGRARLGP